VLRASCHAAVLLLVCAFTFSGTSAQPRPLAIVTAVPRESERIVAKMSGAAETVLEGYRFVVGEIGSRRVVVCNTGIGKVNAAAATTLLIEHHSPSAVIVLGVAGSLNPDLHPGDIVIAEKTLQHDLGILTDEGWKEKRIRNPVDRTENPSEFPADKKLLASAAGKELGGGAKVVRGIVVTGDVFVSSPKKKDSLRESFKADLVDMESGAVAQVCWQQGVPFLAIRSVSDQAGHGATVEVHTNFDLAVSNLAELMSKILDEQKQ